MTEQLTLDGAALRDAALAQVEEASDDWQRSVIDQAIHEVADRGRPFSAACSACQDQCCQGSSVIPGVASSENPCVVGRLTCAQTRNDPRHFGGSRGSSLPPVRRWR